MLDFVALDFGTANSYRGSPCAVGLVRVRGGAIVDEGRLLIRPPESVDFFDPYNTRVHGIAAVDVADSPRWCEVLPALVDDIGEDVVVAHNAGFDIGVIRYACAADGIEWPTMRFLCTLVLTRRALSLPSYRLPFVAEALGFRMGDHHDPLADARAVVGIIKALAERQRVDDLESLAAAFNVGIGRMSGGLYRGSAANPSGPGKGGLGLGNGRPVRPDSHPDADPDGYLYGRVVVFTGSLSSMTRQMAWEECARVGAIPEANTTRRTNVLVIGDVNPAALRPGADLTGKAEKAFRLQAGGQDIEVMTEDDLLRCLEGKSLARV